MDQGEVYGAMRIYTEEAFSSEETASSRPFGRRQPDEDKEQLGAEGLGPCQERLCSASAAMLRNSDLCVFLGRGSIAFVTFSKGSITLTQFRGVPLSVASFKDSQTSAWMLSASAVFACPTLIPASGISASMCLGRTRPLPPHPLTRSHSMWFLWDRL